MTAPVKCCPVHMEVGPECKFCIDNEFVIRAPELVKVVRKINARGENVSIIGAYRRVIEGLALQIKTTQR